MTEYRLAALLFVEVTDRDERGEPLNWRRYRQDDTIEVTGSEEQRLLEAGALAPLGDTAHPAEHEAGGHPVAPEPHGATPRPPKAGSHAAWVDYAVSRGVDRELAESMTKAELIAEYASE